MSGGDYVTEDQLRASEDRIIKRIDDMDRRINGRIRTLEKFRWQLVGGAAALSLVLGIALRAVTL